MIASRPEHFPISKEIEVTFIWTEGGSHVLLAADFLANWTNYQNMEKHGEVFIFRTVKSIAFT